MMFSAPAAKPNIVFVLVDDMGWKDTGVTGSTIYKTPNLDKLANSGVRFTQAYSAAPVCSPSRAAILSGKHPARVGITDWLPGASFPDAPLKPPPMPEHLDPQLTTLPEILRANGYATWNVGKWHLGAEPYGPTAHGFDVNIAGSESGHPASFFYPYGHDSGSDWRVRPLDGGKPGEYLTDRLTQESIKLIRRRDERPFFLFLSHYTVHMPIEAPEADVEPYLHHVGPGFTKRRAVYAGMLAALDRSMGQLVDCLRMEKMDKNTLIVFTSDNGGLVEVTDNLPLRGGKGMPFEGGTRVPLFIAAADLEPKVVETPVTGTDFLPSLLSYAGIKTPRGLVLDGASFTGVLTGAALRTRSLAWHYPHYHMADRKPHTVWREGDWKLIHWYETRISELYNLKSDPSEKQNLAATHPNQVRQMEAGMQTWLSRVGAKLPSAN